MPSPDKKGPPQSAQGASTVCMCNHLKRVQLACECRPHPPANTRRHGVLGRCSAAPPAETALRTTQSLQPELNPRASSPCKCAATDVLRHE